MKRMRVFVAAMLAVMLVMPASGAPAASLDEVREAMKQRDFRTALELVETLVEQEPDSTVVLGLHARALHQNARIEEALAVWKRLQAKAPGDKAVARAVAKASDLLDRLGARLRFLESMVEQERSVTAECRRLLDSFHPLSMRGRLRMVLAKSLFLDGKLDEAVDEAARLREDEAGREVSDKAWLLIANIHNAKPERRERALKTIDAFLDREPAPSKPLLLEGRLRFQREDAIIYFTK